jgi:hypothetical protein
MEEERLEGTWNMAFSKLTSVVGDEMRLGLLVDLQRLTFEK